MKVPPKRKGNGGCSIGWAGKAWTLNESPSEKEGKFRERGVILIFTALNESPSEKEGKSKLRPKRSRLSTMTPQ